MTNVKEKSMVKVTVKTSSGDSEYKGIVALVTSDKLVLIPFDTVSKNAKGLHILHSYIESVSSVRFPKDVSELLKEGFSIYQDYLLLEREIEDMERRLKEKRNKLREKEMALNAHTEKLDLKRFEVLTSPQDIANKLMIDLEDLEADCIYQPGVSTKSVRVSQVKADGKNILLTVQFKKEIFGEHCSELSWVDFERFYDCMDWEAFKEKYCPKMEDELLAQLPNTKLVKTEKDCGRGEEKRRVPLKTSYTLSIKINKDNYNEVLQSLVSGLKRFNTTYITNGRV